MEIDDNIRHIIEQTQVLRSPKQKLSTFGTTNIYYYMITELIEDTNIIREGRVIAARPQLVTPAYLINIEGFSSQARRYIEMLADSNPHEPGIFYTYRNEMLEMNIVSQPLPEVFDKINRRIEEKGDPLSAVIKGVEDMWDVSLMKFTFELTTSSFSHNIFELYGRGFVHTDTEGIPKGARMYIEELFDKTAHDPSIAPELISELQRWNLWAEYQDRFLQLFREK